jgi:D-alanyl-D-alanine carboxypeptidase/D-alanyl-D-alanine-endopeptidase (penicillin-binding protein 4)
LRSARCSPKILDVIRLRRPFGAPLLAVLIAATTTMPTAEAAPRRVASPARARPLLRSSTPSARPKARAAEPVRTPIKDPNDPDEKRIAELRDSLLAVMRDRPLSSTRLGVEVMRASDGEVLFSHNADARFNPASNTKMLTTAAAMAFLGPDWRYRTTLSGPAPDSDGVVHGDVVLRGSGDPSLTATDLGDLARDLARNGVTKIDGNLYAEPGDGALILHRNTYAVHVRSTSPGQRAQVWVEPRSALFVVDNQAQTVKGKRSRLKIDAYRKDDHLVVTVRGRIAETRGEYVDARRLGDGALYAGWTLREALSDFGVELTGEVKTGTLPTHNVLAIHRSAPLSDVCRISNKPSNNFVAEAIYRTLGGELYGGPGTTEKGTRAIREFMSAFGVDHSRYTIINGSGLTHENRLTAADLTQILRSIYFDVAIAPEFLTSLAIAGIDGTIRNRFQGTEAVGLVRAKTGTLSGVSALSGYVGDKDDVLVFTIFVEGFRHKRTNEVRRAQVRMVQAMLRYLHAEVPRRDGPPTTIEPTDDSEADGDPSL